MNPEEQLRFLLRRVDQVPVPESRSQAAFFQAAHRSLLIHRMVGVIAAVLVTTVAVAGASMLVGDRGGPPPVDEPSPDRSEQPVCDPAPPLQINDLGVVAFAANEGLHKVDVASGQIETLVSSGIRANAGAPVRFSPSGRWISFGPGRLIPSAGGPVCLPSPDDLHQLTWSPLEDIFVAKTRDGRLVNGGPSHPLTEIAAPELGTTNFVFDPSGTRLAVGRVTEEGSGAVAVIDLENGTTTDVLSLAPESGLVPEIATWSPDGDWILYWETFGETESLNADGGALKAVRAAGGDSLTVVDEMLFYSDFITWCGDTLIAAGGGGRGVTENKSLITAAAPEWRPTPIEGDPGESTFWPHCSPDLQVAATSTEDEPEQTFGQNRRHIDFFPLADPSNAGGFAVDQSSASAEFPRWSRNHDGEVVMLFVARESSPESEASIYLQQNATQRRLADLGRVESLGYFGHYQYGGLFDWYQP